MGHGRDPAGEVKTHTAEKEEKTMRVKLDGNLNVAIPKSMAEALGARRGDVLDCIPMIALCPVRSTGAAAGMFPAGSDIFPPYSA